MTRWLSTQNQEQEEGAPVQEESLATLMIRYQEGDFCAFKQLYATLVEEVRRYFVRICGDRAMAADLVQDLFLEIHRSRRSYTAPLPVRPWVFGIARNVAARRHRAARLRPGTLSEHPDLIETAETPVTGIPSAEALDIERALTALPETTRGAWLMHHLFGFSFESIAARMGITVMAAKLRSSRATRALRLALRTTGKSSQ
jgi:RNA polymerase sigma factor (sigma-70 family)